MKLALTFLFLLFLSICQGQTIPANRSFNWSNSGYQGTIPAPANIIDFLSVGGMNDGLTDNSSALQNAISTATKPVVIYLSPGEYLFNTSINLPDSTILRGYSSDSTKLIFNFAGSIGNGINIFGSANGAFTNVISGAERFNNFVTVVDPSSFLAGDFAEIQQTNGSWDIQPISWADNSIGQILHIISINGDTLFFDEGLRIDYNYSLNPQIRKITTRREVGIECLNIERADSVHVGVCFNVNFSYASNCWINGVEIGKSIGSHIEIDASTNISIARCYIHDNFEYDGTSTHGYGITQFGHTGQCRIENNIMRHLRHSFSMQCGANGNVVAYNYSLEPNRSEFPADFGADISMHGHFTYANLFEGNIVQNIQIDQTWGPTGPLNTFFRNRAELYGILMSSGSVQSDSLNFIGNEVTNTAPFMGNYTLTGAGHFGFGNNIKGTITPTGTSPLPDSSYYLDSLPIFWTSSIFPTIGIPNTIGSGTIPAKERFLSGVFLAPCAENINTSVSETTSLNYFEIFPNPFSEEINLSISSSIQEKITIQIKDIQGKIILEKHELTSFGKNKYQLSTSSLGKGIYFLKVFSAHFMEIEKVMKY